MIRSEKKGEVCRAFLQFFILPLYFLNKGFLAYPLYRDRRDVIMAYLILDDGHVEASEYKSYYLYFDENDPHEYRWAIELSKKTIHEIDLKKIKNRLKN